jgi:ppGpp synthetase/RelA/SpoT-type nucleotidyltranferase
LAIYCKINIQTNKLFTITKKREPSLTEAQKEIIIQYTKLYPEYRQLGKELQNLIESLLREANVGFINVTQRAKEINSFQAKMVRKNYRNPLRQMMDLCAIRIICGFPKDLKKVEEVLGKNFKITAHKNKERNISPYKFWYRSHHYKIRLSNGQIYRKNYKLLKNFTAEIQVRTVFMDAWAKMEHEINYKHDWATSLETKRKLSRLSAMLELADEQLQELIKKDRKKTINKDKKNYIT